MKKFYILVTDNGTREFVPASIHEDDDIISALERHFGGWVEAVEGRNGGIVYRLIMNRIKVAVLAPEGVSPYSVI